MVTKTRVYNWYIAMVAAGCMVLYGYDAAVFNAVQGNKHWLAYFDTPQNELLGLINTSYSIGAICAGWFVGGPTADYLGRRWGMGIGCFITVVATIIQTFAPRHKIGVFIFGRVLIGIGQGMALTAGSVFIGEVTPPEIRGKVMSFWQLFYCWFFHRVLGQLRLFVSQIYSCGLGLEDGSDVPDVGTAHDPRPVTIPP